MTPADVRAKVDELLALPGETEWAEFKHNNTNPQELGEYLSALSKPKVRATRTWSRG